MDAVIDTIGFDNEEYYDSYRGCKSTVNEIMTKKQSARGIMEDIVANYSSMSFDTEEIQKNIADPNNLTLLKDILTKLG
jgi:trehalose-6-phosphate synthase